MIDRRSFLRRMGAGATAAVAALKWKAPERRPEPFPEASVESEPSSTVAEVDPKAVAVGSEGAPDWWAKLEVDGSKFYVSEIEGPVVSQDYVEDVDADISFLPGPRSMTLGAKLWAGPGVVERLHQFLDLGRTVSAELEVPTSCSAVPTSPPARYTFNGRLLEMKTEYMITGFPLEIDTVWALDGLNVDAKAENVRA